MVVKVDLRARAIVIWIMATHVEVMVLVVDCCLEVGRACGRYHISLALLMKVVAFVRSRIGISMITIVNP